MGNEGDLGVERKKRRQESVSPVAADPDTLDSDDSKEAEGRARHSRLKEELYKQRESSVFPLSRLMRGFRN